MTQNEFNALCCELLVDCELAIECEEVRLALHTGKPEEVRKAIIENF